MVAVKARLVGAGVNLDATAYPHCIPYGDSDPAQFGRLGGGESERTTWLQTTVVGVSEEQCRALLARVLAALEGWHPTIPERRSYRVAHESSQPVRPNPDLPDKTLWIATDQWVITTVPA